MVKIRLRRMGSRNHPFYRVVVSDARKTPTGAALDEIGYYDPRKQPAVVSIDRERLDRWVSKGALLSPTVSKLLKQAPAPASAGATAAAQRSPVQPGPVQPSAAQPAAESQAAAQT